MAHKTKSTKTDKIEKNEVKNMFEQYNNVTAQIMKANCETQVAFIKSATDTAMKIVNTTVEAAETLRNTAATPNFELNMKTAQEVTSKFEKLATDIQSDGKILIADAQKRYTAITY